MSNSEKRELGRCPLSLVVLEILNDTKLEVFFNVYIQILLEVRKGVSMINYSKNIIQRVNFQPYNNLEKFHL